MPDQQSTGPRSVAVLLDVDGTLVDTNYLHTVAWWRAFRDTGRAVPMTDVHRAIGMGSDKLLDFVAPDRDRDRDDALSDAHSGYYMEYRDLLSPLPGARALVHELAQRGYVVVLATSASPEEVDALRRALDVEDDLAAVTGKEDVDNAKPEPDLVAAALDRAGVPAERAVMVGDTVWDVEAARKLGVACVGVLTGGLSRSELEEAGAAAVYRDARALLEDLDASPVGRLRAGSAG